LKILLNSSAININEIFTISTLIEAKIMSNAYFKNLKNEYEDKLIKIKYLKKSDYLNVEFWYEKDACVNLKNCKFLFT
jgi:hypothetical protein